KEMKSAIDDSQNNPGMASEIKRTLRKVKNPEIVSKFQSFLENPDSASNISLRDAEDMKRAFNQNPLFSKSGWHPEWKSGDLEIKDLLDQMKSAQSEVFPELSEKRKP